MKENTKFKPIKSLGVAKAFLIVPFRWSSFKSLCGYLYTVVTKFFWLQFSVKLGFRKIPVLPVDNTLDKKVPFSPLKVPVYLAESPLTCVVEGTGVLLNNIPILENGLNKNY